MSTSQISGGSSISSISQQGSAASANSLAEQIKRVRIVGDRALTPSPTPTKQEQDNVAARYALMEKRSSDSQLWGS